MRISNPCDGCSLRRVRCSGGQPCRECQSRSVSCSFLRTRKKRGPRGPRSRTSEKIEIFQQQLQKERKQIPCDKWVESITPEATVGTPGATFAHRFSFEVYQPILEIFHQRLYCIWPVVSYDDLVSKLRNDPSDFESYSLASALCAAVIAQLRLPEYTAPVESATSKDFEAEAQRLRLRFEYHEHYTLSSLLTSFFLHVYFANSDKLRTAGFFLRESLTYAHGLQLQHPDTYDDVGPARRQLMLRVYWILFISERTFCVQNGLPATLRPIDLLPDAQVVNGDDGSPLPAFLSLTRLFTYLKGHLLDATIPPYTMLRSSMERPEQISRLQQALGREEIHRDLNESQKVDIIVTRSWIRILLWQYTITKFAVSCHAQDDAFSAFLPVTVACDMLSVFARVSKSSIEPHGYGMELKIFRIADALVDVLACTPTSTDTHGLLMHSRGSLHLLESVLLAVGGAHSQFVAALRHRMAELRISPAISLRAEPLILSGEIVDEENGPHDHTNDHHRLRCQPRGDSWTDAVSFGYG